MRWDKTFKISFILMSFTYGWLRSARFISQRDFAFFQALTCEIALIGTFVATFGWCYLRYLQDREQAKLERTLAWHLATFTKSSLMSILMAAVLLFAIVDLLIPLAKQAPHGHVYFLIVIGCTWLVALWFWITTIDRGEAWYKEAVRRHGMAKLRGR